MPSSPRIPRFAVIDVETTGLTPADERIIELAIIRADEHGRSIDQWVTRLDPGRPVGATHVHGLTDADLADAPTFAQQALVIGRALQGLVVVAHNADFDIAFLHAEFSRASLPMPRFTTYCTLRGSTLYLPHLARRRLADCCAPFGIANTGAHSALGDASATAQLLQRYLALDAETGYDAPLTASRALRPAAAPAPIDPVPAPEPPSPADGTSPISAAAVRAWARESGIPVGERGRLPAGLVAQYREAMAPGSASAQSSRVPAPPTAAPPSGPEPAAASGPREAPSPTFASTDTPSDAPTRPLTITPEFQAALDHLHAGHHLFLTGKAGTGKSTLIRHYLETTARRTITVAPTGIAALNVDGYTIHRLFSFPVGVTEDMVRGSGYYPRRFAKALKELDTLIVDEASMVRADLFDALTAALERFGPRPGTPFGGVQLVLVGDLYQLPPVVTDQEAAWIEERFGTPFFFSARSFDAAAFPVVELGTVFRQLGEDQLVHLLNAVREGTLLEDARAELNRRTDPNFEPDLDEFWLTLATTNRIVGARNRQMLERLPDPARTSAARITGDTDGFEHPTEASLSLAVGAQVMMLTNDPLDRWANGTLGRITAITENAADDDGPVVTVLLRDGRTVAVRRHIWEITRPSVQGGALVHEVVGTFTQLPMKLAWAITIHKSQGQTLDRVVVDLTGGTFANGQLYVALSRCTSLEGLVLKREVLPRDLKTDQRVRRYLATGAAPTDVLGEAYLSVLTVGTEGGQWRPRPVEIAVVTDDGDEATTVINPTSDLFDARSMFGLATRDVQLAPLLAEAWPALSSMLAGRVPVGVNVDRQLAHIDFELKRNGIVEPIPLGLELPGGLLRADELARLKAPTALERARAVRDAVQRVRRAGADLPGTGTAFRQLVHGHGYLLARTTGAEGTTAPTGFVVGGNLTAEDDSAEVLARLLTVTWERVLSPDQEVMDRLRTVEQHYGVSVLPAGFEAAGPVDLAAVLVPGARICFSGSVDSPAHGPLSKEELHRVAETRGLVAVPTLTKTRTDVLVVAEAGSQSGKAKNAAKWGKPVIVAEEFLTWVGRG
ncbi:exonuclease domain-containing protein [Brachybacterium sp. UNK5269]|uniref:exonuclease domain-containing protein n=1 Tax=Brachybacterium sp. UNK5269 TaxID=3408576 RepID=UPI003BAF34BE